MAKQMATEVEKAHSTFQCALSTKAGCECVANIMQTLTDQDAEAIMVSIDGSGRTICKQCWRACCDGEGRSDPPLVNTFLWQSIDFWGDETGTSQDIPQGEGGEQGDTLMPLLFALGLPPPRSGESCCRARRSSRSLMTCTSSVHHHRVLEVHRILEEELRSHAQISLHHGKTQVWKRSGVPPRGIDMCCRLARGRIAAAMPARAKILGVPVGKPDFVLSFFGSKIGRTVDSVSTHPSCGRSPGNVVAFCAPPRGRTSG